MNNYVKSTKWVCTAYTGRADSFPKLLEDDVYHFSNSNSTSVESMGKTAEFT